MTESSGDQLSGDQRLSALPMFPLPGCVFFPNTLLPLHVFEPRYRQLTEHVLEGEGLMLVANLRGAEVPGALSDVHPIAGLGRVVHHEQLPDGRFHILLQGLARARLTDELPAGGLLYRRAKVELLDSVLTDEEAAATEVTTLKACYSQVVHSCTSEHLVDLCDRVSDPGVLADVVCASVIEDPADRQAALEDVCVVARLKRANDALASLLLGNMGDGSQVH